MYEKISSVGGTLSGVKKSFYLFLTSVLGSLLFLIVHRVVVFFFLYLLTGGYITTSLSYYEFLFWDYFSLVIVIMLGIWYGIWLGLYWFQKVYEEGCHAGFADHIVKKYFSSKDAKNLPSKMSAIKHRLTEDLEQLESLAKQTMPISPEPIKRKIVRKRAPKKLQS